MQVHLMRIKMNPEPLGVAAEVIVPSNIRRWSDTPPSQYLTDYSVIGETPRHIDSPFPYDPEINSKLILW